MRTQAGTPPTPAVAADLAAVAARMGHHHPRRALATARAIAASARATMPAMTATSAAATASATTYGILTAHVTTSCKVPAAPAHRATRVSTGQAPAAKHAPPPSTALVARRPHAPPARLGSTQTPGRTPSQTATRGAGYLRTRVAHASTRHQGIFPKARLTVSIAATRTNAPTHGRKGSHATTSLSTVAHVRRVLRATATPARFRASGASRAGISSSKEQYKCRAQAARQASMATMSWEILPTHATTVTLGSTRQALDGLRVTRARVAGRPRARVATPLATAWLPVPVLVLHHKGAPAADFTKISRKHSRAGLQTFALEPCA